MALVDLTTVASLLACPACHSTLDRTSDGYVCTGELCELARRGSFASIGRGRWPVLADFRDSVLSSEGLPSPESPTGRREGWSSERLPTWLRPIWKPYNRVAARNVDLMLSLLGTSPIVLVVGGGQIGNGVERLYRDAEPQVVGFDLYESQLTQLIADAHKIPFATSSVDAVIVQAVLEHVLDPVRVVSEIWRVLRPAGLVYAETPFLQQVHAGRLDFTRFTSSGHRYLFRNFDEVAAGPVAGPGTQLQWALDHTVRAVLRSELAGKITRGLFFWLRYLDGLVPMSYAMDNASAYYFLGRRADREFTAREIMAYYKGAQQPARGDSGAPRGRTTEVG